jgi:hypothetical protein
MGAQANTLTGWDQEEDKRRTGEAGFDVYRVNPGRPRRSTEVAGRVAAGSETALYATRTKAWSG